MCVTHLLVYLTEHLRLSCTHLLWILCSTSSAIQHNSYLHQHLPLKGLQASSCSYRYMCLVLSPFLSELAGKDIAHFSLESGRVFEETTGVYERIYSGAPNVNIRKISVRKTI